jgi:hypothetical protein
MQVEHGLAGILITIHDNAIAAIDEAFLLRNFTCRRKKTTDYGLIADLDIVDRGYMLLRNDDGVRRGLWINIAKGQCSIGFVDNICWNFARENFAKQAIWIRHNRYSLFNTYSAVERV